MKKYNVSLDEALITNVEDFTSFNHFFTRKLKPGARKICTDKDAIISPVDGYTSEFGKIHENQLLQAKSINYTLEDLLANKVLSESFVNGSFATLYLAPHNYHRIHMPLDGVLETMIYIPGTLFSVNGKAVKNIPNIFTKNERVVCIFNTSLGRVAVILVGAMIVGGIETFWHGTITPPHKCKKKITTWNYDTSTAKHIKLFKGEEMGLFNLGSTVILLFEKNNVAWSKSLNTGNSIVLGEKIATTI